MMLFDETVMMNTVNETTEKWIIKLIKNEWKCKIAFKENDETIQGIITELNDKKIVLHEIKFGTIGRKNDTFDLLKVKSISMIENEYHRLT